MTPQEINEKVASKLYPEIPTGLINRDFCHSIEAAWEIVEWMRYRNIHTTISDSDSSTWFVQVESRESNPVIHPIIEVSESAPMAICKAFLKLQDIKK